MRALRRSITSRTGLAVIAAGLAGCLFPTYTFEDDGGGETPTSTSSGGGGSASTMNGTSTVTGGAGGDGATGGAGGEDGGGGSTSSTVDLEVCTNGVDDDADGDIDCGDTGCSDEVSCVAPPPEGWTGPFLVYEGPSGGFAGCPAEYPDTDFQGNSGLVAPDATCSACTCGAPQNQQCNMPALFSTGDAMCGQGTFCSGDMPLPPGWTGACNGNTQFPGGQTTCGMNANATCSSSTGVACNQSVSMNAMTVTPGSCTPGTSTPTTQPPSWSNLVVACGNPTVVAAGCNGDFTCLPKPGPDFIDGLCIAAPGVQACPSGAFTNQHVFHTGFTDDRDCSTCSCASSSGATCTANVTIYSNNQVNTCTAPIATLSISNSAGDCENLSGNPAIATHSATITGPTGGTCAPSGGAPIGSADPDPDLAKTFCCL
ncbi:MAG: hypothetical protein HOW73_46810 [Polyangiaceae bacterium]|nr:hypothetical protein [Polyangiaceae bacterium]